MHARLPAAVLACVAFAGGLAGSTRAGAQPAPSASGSEGEPPEEEPTASGSVAPPAPASAIPVPRGPIPFEDGMLRLPGGRFTMGTADPRAPPNERPPHVETVRPFWIDRTEVTVGAYHECVDRHACKPPARSSATCTYDLGDPLLPVSCVAWADADVYCRAVMKRLPREVEWEFAARGTTRSRFPWGGVSTSCAIAATLLNDATGRSCTGKRPSRVGAHPAGASVFGALDMAGNVEEWTSDWYSEGVAGGAAPASGASHVLRGGGWLSAPSASRTTSRNWGSSLEAGPNVGFRCAKDDR